MKNIVEISQFRIVFRAWQVNKVICVTVRHQHNKIRKFL